MTGAFRWSLILLCCSLAGAAEAGQAAADQAEQANSRFRISPRGYVQIDWRAYPDWTVATGTGRLNHDPIEIRRLRAGVDGRWRRLSYEFTVDPQDEDGTFVKDAYVQLRLTPALRVRVGQFKLPGSREYQQSARSTDFMERAALAESVSAGRDAGAMLSGSLGRRVDYQVGVFGGDGNGRGSRSGVTAATRVAWSLSRDLEIAGWLTEGRTTAVDSEAANGLSGRASSGYRFFERVYVQGHRTRVGLDVEWSPAPWRLAVEWASAWDTRSGQGLDYEDLPAVTAAGWSAAVTRELGRRRGKGQKRSRIRELDVSVRLDALSFDDSSTSNEADSVRLRATNIRRRAETTATVGLSWSPTRWMRVLSSLSVERYPEPRSAPEPGRASNYWLFGTRLQFELP